MKRTQLSAIALASILGAATFSGAISTEAIPGMDKNIVAEAATSSVIGKVKNPDTYKYTESQYYFLREINKLRKGMGIPELVLDPYLAQAAENHFQYIYNTGINEHEQNKRSNKKYFSGVDEDERIEYVGFTQELHDSDKYYSYQVGGELLGMTSQNKSYKHATGIYEHTAVGHFVELIHPSANAVGTNKNIKKGNVVNMFVNGDFYLNEDASDYRDVPSYMYPYNGQVDVEPGYRDNEESFPVRTMVGTRDTGKPIVYFFPKYVDKELGEPSAVTKFTAHLYDSEGNEVLTKHNFDAEDEGYIDDVEIVPYQLLLYGEKYTVKVDVQFENGKKHSDKWSFTTAGKKEGIGKLKMRTNKQATVYNTKGKKVGVVTSKKAVNIVDKRNGRFYLTKDTYVKINKDTVRILGEVGIRGGYKLPYYNSKGKKLGNLSTDKEHSVYKKTTTRLYLAGGNYVNLKDVVKNGAFQDYQNKDYFHRNPNF